MKKSRGLRVSLAAASASALLALDVNGQSTPSSYGGADPTLLNIPAAAFLPRDSSTTWGYSSPGYIYQTAGGVEPFWAPVDLPTGALVFKIGLYFDDTDPDNDLTATLRIYTGGRNNDASFTDVASVSSLGSPGRSYFFIAFGHTVENDTNHGNGMYSIVISNPAPGPALKFKGVELWWVRQVSPAPAIATFNDVPTNHPFFQYIEALKASGITAGCQANPPLYCPDNPVTRGQMAVFLSKALGLHWPD